MSATSHRAATIVAGPTMSGGVGPLLRAVRPRQWTKNALVCAGLLFAGKAGDVTAWLEALTIFVAYSTLSGAAYLINDVRDREADRLHPVKRWRPLASGALTLQRAIALAGTLALGGLAAAGSLGLRSFALAAGFVGLQLAYTSGLKRVPFVDLLVIAALFVMRATAGAVAVHVHASVWLLVCTALLALFLGLAKRRGELMLVHAGHAPGRRALAGYSLVTVERLFDTTAAITVLAYVAYAARAHDSRELLLTTPLVAFGVLRYRHLVRRHGLGEEPENVLLGDPPLLVAIVIWAALAAIILATA